MVHLQIVVAAAMCHVRTAKRVVCAPAAFLTSVISVIAFPMDLRMNRTS